MGLFNSFFPFKVPGLSKIQTQLKHVFFFFISANKGGQAIDKLCLCTLVAEFLKLVSFCHAFCCSELFFNHKLHICSSMKKKNAFVTARVGVSLFVQTLGWV